MFIYILYDILYHLHIIIIIFNAHQVLLVGKPGVGDAVDSYNMNATFFEANSNTVLGAVFNKLPLNGFYSLDSCRDAILSYFKQYKKSQVVYGFLPLVQLQREQSSSDESGIKR